MIQQADMVALVTICRDFMHSGHTLNSLVVHYNLEIGMIYCEVNVNLGVILVPTACSGWILAWILHLCTTQSGRELNARAWGV